MSLLPIDDARSYVMSLVSPLPAVSVPARDAIGLVLADPVAAAEDVPPFESSAVDGYAVRAASRRPASAADPVGRGVVGEVAAGAGTTVVLGDGQAIRIMTGAPVPAGADAIVMVEDTERLGIGADGAERVRVTTSVTEGDARRPAGSDVRAGTHLYDAGTCVTPAMSAVLASANVSTVRVVRRPRVGVLSTGDELVGDDRPLEPGQIRESNRTMLLGMVTAAGCEAVDLGTVRDDEAALEDVLRRAATTCDAIVSSGGVSMGDYDVVKAVLTRLATMRWMQIAIKPAKPFAIGLLDGDGRGVPVFGLPGNPVSSFVSFEVLARPALRAMAGHASPWRTAVEAIADEPLRRRTDGKVHFMRVIATFGADGRVHVVPVSAQASHQLAATSLANGIAEVPDGDGVAAGSPVRTMLLSLA
ncbi:MAG: gephyrin-like molybdotransferase Glp [Ilumatobacteraceae bacterium]